MSEYEEDDYVEKQRMFNYLCRRGARSDDKRVLYADVAPAWTHGIDAIHVGLEDVRASDGIMVSYDFDRDGWVIKQASRFRFSIDDTVCDPDWQEVAFVQSWEREIEYAEDDV